MSEWKKEVDAIYKHDLIMTLKEEFRLLSKAEYYTAFLPSEDGKQIQELIVKRLMEINNAIERLERTT